MDYVVARMQATGHTSPYNAAVPPVAHSIAIAADHRPPPVSQRTRGSAMMQRQRREALEQEVSELKQQLSNEETVHQILERALQQPSSLRSSSMALTNIPAFIPTKAKELLAELLLVEDEIARLEGQIQRMKQGAGAGARGGGNSGAMAAMQQQPPSVAEHCKSMFFISQAMDGEAYLSKVKKSPNPNPNPHPKDDDRRAAMNSMRSPKNNIFFGGAAGLPPRHSLDNKQSSADGHVQVVDKSTNINKPPGSKIAAVLQHQHQHHNHELPITKQISPTVIAAAKRVRDQPQAQPPNKLSERIVKCLVCIFMRLLRSSRVSEMEKSGNLAAKGGSFRMDTGLVNAAANKEKQERGQQDHYGIFGVQDAIVRDIGPYKNLVRFTSTSLDLLRGFSASPLLTKLREMLEALQQVDVRSLNHQQRLAFWLNIYNTCIMHGILQHGLPSNSDKLLALKNKATINVSGQTFNALVIENFILRQPSSVKEEFWKCDVDVEEQAVREVYGLKTSEPNILFALCCGIRSSPALRIYKADRVVMDLEKAKLEYLQASLVVTSTRRLMIPSLVHSNMHDFAKDMESLLRWICEQLPTSWSLRKSMLDCLNFSSTTNVMMMMTTMEELPVDVIPLDYEFQYLLLPM
ncbi:uncharacterized protein LOC8059237 isoform X2 [Sorghum bicolor]|uniref:DUF547 domain-containing protein n=1 Tax=Sorghum bicolor TaxID=4558 RepID=C5WRV3_SORBI|nr:uncharacterized protein LOC8059237 isoform X2 [Sorghum bicolor]EER93055.2 hypothetical protein SORBI_3001G002800 [Sorghum bicolor]|eukprot:XP_021310810.1 uncharacterized protein LOC8059237 isoform X2 [Sorghum bicolor]